MDRKGEGYGVVLFANVKLVASGPWNWIIQMLSQMLSLALASILFDDSS